MNGNCVWVDPGYDVAAVHSAEWRTARKPHLCTECRETIPPGEKYEHVRGMWDGVWSTFRTCVRCLGVRADYFPREWVYSMMVEDFGEAFGFDYRDGIPPDFAPCGKLTGVLP